MLVIGAEKLSSIVNWTDRNTCVLFGDGAGAAILQNRANSHGLLTAVMGADGNKADLLSMPGGGSACPASAQTVADGLHFLRMDGKETFKNAVQAMVSRRQRGACAAVKLTSRNIKCVIPHQANRRIIDAVGERLGATPEQFSSTSTNTATPPPHPSPSRWTRRCGRGRSQRGDLILLVVFGAGLTWGAAVIEW